MKGALNDWKFIVLACLTLGLAPYWPWPHLLTKTLWILRGGKGFDWADGLDLAVHALPWFFLARLILRQSVTWWEKKR